MLNIGLNDTGENKSNERTKHLRVETNRYK